MSTLMSSKRFIEKFKSKTKKVGDCLIWTGGNPKRYGYVWYEGKTQYVHRVAYKLFIGKIPRGNDVCHHCDVMACINPDHLFTGSRQDNMDDAARKGRIISGEKHKGSKLTNLEVSQLRRVYRKGGITEKELSRLYGITRSYTCAIINKRARRHL